jgi:biotin-dependent carboxylase-like uncharacterized protein
MVRVLKSGFYTSIQDLGRFGYQEYGVPYSGVMDQYSAAVANGLLGNESDKAVMEITMTGPTLEFCRDTFICVSGADMSLKINDEPVQINRIIKVTSGDIISFGKLNYGFRCYLAVLGGFKSEKIMKSYSMYKGITSQFRLLKNDKLPIQKCSDSIHKKNASLKIKQSLFNSENIEVFKGPEFDKLTKVQQEQLISSCFTVSKDNNRMAYQLNESLENQLAPIITSAILPGTVQLTPSGKLIILMRDCQTTGGYPRVLQLKESAINVLAQKFTGQSVIFKLNSKY